MSDFFSDIMKNGALDSLTADQLDELILRAQAIRSEQQNGKEETRIDACPHCGSIAIKKHGTTSKGSIRMICKDCGKTFTLSENPNTRLTRSQLTALFTGVIENLPIGKLAERMGVSRSTAHRHKIQIGDILFQKLAKDLGAVNEEGKPTLVFEGIIQCDEWYCPVSFKGKRNPEFFIWKLRRFPRHNMTMTEQDEYLKKHGLWEQVTAIPGYLQELRDNTKTYKRGISNEQVCIVVAVDDEQRPGGTGDGKHRKPPVNGTVLHKFRHIPGQLLFGEIVRKIHQVLRAQIQNGVRPGRKQVGHVRRAGRALPGCQKQVFQVRRGGHIGDIDNDALLLAHRGVEFLHQRVYGRIGLLPVNVPHRQRDGLLGVQL